MELVDFSDGVRLKDADSTDVKRLKKQGLVEVSHDYIVKPTIIGETLLKLDNDVWRTKRKCEDIEVDYMQFKEGIRCDISRLESLVVSFVLAVCCIIWVLV